MKIAMVGLGALYARLSSRRQDSFAARLPAALRNRFGGLAVTLESGLAGLETPSSRS